MTEEPLSICPECGGHIRRVLYPAGVIFKGSGFYVNDHKGHVAGAKGEAKKEEGAADTAKPKSDESKPSESSTSAPKETSTSGDNKASSAA